MLHSSRTRPGSEFYTVRVPGQAPSLQFPVRVLCRTSRTAATAATAATAGRPQRLQLWAPVGRRREGADGQREGATLARRRADAGRGRAKVAMIARFLWLTAAFVTDPSAQIWARLGLEELGLEELGAKHSDLVDKFSDHHCPHRLLTPKPLCDVERIEPLLSQSTRVRHG